MNKLLRSVCALAMVVLAVCSLVGCGFAKRQVYAKDLTESVKARSVSSRTTDKNFRNVYNGFAVRMLNELYEGKNTCISPLSIAAAFGMVTNGAKGETKAELEALFGADIATLNAYFAELTSRSVESKELHVANSVWSRNGAVTVENDFLDIVKNYYNAQVYTADFDSKTVTDINNWVYNNTRGGIDKIVESIGRSTVMFLINALDFEAEWAQKFEQNKIADRTFYGTQNESTVKMMSAEEYTYIHTTDASGFVKAYKGGEYKFAALLPDESINIADFVGSLTGERIAKALSDAEQDSVRIGLPKFEYDSEFDLVPALQKLGVNRAFDIRQADFSDMGKCTDGNLFIGSAIHKTHIAVDEEKTKASAVTSISMDTKVDSGPSREVILDRPFVYMILDGDDLPMFIGVVANIG